MMMRKHIFDIKNSELADLANNNLSLIYLEQGLDKL